MSSMEVRRRSDRRARSIATSSHPARPARRRAAVALAALVLLSSCGGAEIGPPVVSTVQLETGGSDAIIGEYLTLIGYSFGEGLTVTIGGVDAQVLEESRTSVRTQVPPETPAGPVDVVVHRGSVRSEPVQISVRRLAYTANFTDLSLTVLSVAGTDVSVVGRVSIDVPPGPFAVAFSPDGRRAVVAASIAFLPESIVDTLAPGAPPGDSVAIVDVLRGEVTGVVATGVDSKPTGVAISRDGSTAWVTNYAPSTVSVIDLDTAELRGEIAVPRQPEEIALSGDGSLLLVNSDGGTVSTIDTATGSVVGTASTGGNDPSGVAFSPDATTGYATNSFVDPSLGEDGTLTVLDLAAPADPEVIATVAAGIGPTPYDVKVAPGGLLGIVTNLNVVFAPLSIGPGSISLVDLASAPPVVTAVIPVGVAPIHAAITGGGAVALVGNGLGGSVSVVDLGTRAVVGTVALDIPIGPADVAVQP
jgi:DNA-binding beta-propeller fold protein YncE